MVMAATVSTRAMNNPPASNSTPPPGDVSDRQARRVIVWLGGAANSFIAGQLPSGAGRLRSTQRQHRIDTSYRISIGKARLSILNTSGGVSTAAAAKTPT